MIPCKPWAVMFAQRQCLTPTEIVIADLAGRGRRTDEIAQELEIEPETVANHLAQVYRKLGIEPGGSLAPEAKRSPA